MSLQLHRPDGEGGLEPRTVPDRTGATSSTRRAGVAPRGRQPARAQEPRDEPDLAVPLGAVLAGLGVATFVILVARLRHGLLEPRRDGLSRPPRPRRRGPPRPPILTSHALLFQVRRLERPRDPTHPTPGRRDQQPRARIRGPERRRDPLQFAEIRDEIREVAVEDQPSEEELTHPDLERRRELGKERRQQGNDKLQKALDEAMPEIFAMTREAFKRTLAMRPFDVQLMGCGRAPPGPHRRDEDRRGQDPHPADRRHPQFDDRAWRAHRHGQRLPGPTRPAVDGPGLPLPGDQPRDDHPRHVVPVRSHLRHERRAAAQPAEPITPTSNAGAS